MKDKNFSSEHVLIAASYRWPAYAPAFADALENIGVKVSRFPFETYLEDFASRLQVRVGIGPSIVALNLRLRSAVKHLQPTVCLVWNGLAVWPSTVRYLARHCWVTSYTNDDPFGPRGSALFWRHFRHALPYYDSHHVYRDINVSEYQARGATNVGVLRSYYVPWLHYPEVADQTGDDAPSIVFVGHGEYDRVKVLTALAKKGLPVRVYGPSKTWGELQGKDTTGVEFFAGGLDPTRYRQVLSRAAICLGFFSRLNRDDYTRRYFEIPACGGFLLAMRSKLVQSLYVEGKEAEFFDTPDEVVHKCQQYLANPTRRHEIAKAGLRRCKDSGYDVVSRARKWLQEMLDFRSCA
jgi:hypothetical protein